MIVGFNAPAAWFAKNDTERQLLYQAVANRVGTVRIGCRWSDVQKGATANKCTWDKVDLMVSQALAAGLEVVFCITGPRAKWGWLYSQGGSPVDYGNFCSWLAQRYPAVKYFELWNEPNSNTFWGKKYNPIEYGAYLHEASVKIRLVRPDAKIILGGLGIGNNQGGWGDPVAFLRTLYAAGLGPDFDIVSYHGYSADGGWKPQPVGITQMMLAKFLDIQRLMADNGDLGKPLWATECGIPISVGEETQALRLRELLALLDFIGVQRAYIHSLRDHSSDFGKNYGLLRADGTPRAADSAVRKAGWFRAGI